jgi:hypothetical protein
MKQFAGAALEAAKASAEKWITSQKNIVLTLSPATYRTESGAWLVWVYFTRTNSSS